MVEIVRRCTSGLRTARRAKVHVT